MTTRSFDPGVSSSLGKPEVLPPLRHIREMERPPIRHTCVDPVLDVSHLTGCRVPPIRNEWSFAPLRSFAPLKRSRSFVGP